jgi:hypothetical protein
MLCDNHCQDWQDRSKGCALAGITCLPWLRTAHHKDVTPYQDDPPPPTQENFDRMIERFMSKVEKDRFHWTWTGAVSGCGQPVFHVNHNSNVTALRWAMLNIGHIERPSGNDTFPGCGNPLCVRPEHGLYARHGKRSNADKEKVVSNEC